MSTKASGPVRVAVIGAGGISGAHGNGFLKHAQRIRCVALVDVSAENLKKRSEQLVSHSPRTFSDWKTMLREMGEQIDAVDICLPHHLHAPAILDSAAAGKHILCEKPMCTSLEEADQILQAVRQSGVTYMSAHNQLFLPVVREAKRRIVEGQIGRVYWLRSCDCFAAGAGTRDKWGWRADIKTQGGGELIDTGYHPSYRLLHLAGSKAVAVNGTMGRYKQAIDGEDTASVQIRFENGAIGEILTSWAFPLPHGTHQIHVIGERGQLFGSENTLYHLPNGAKEPVEYKLESADTFTDQLAHFAECLQTGTRPLHGAQEGRDVLELILRATASADGWQPDAVLKV